MLESLGSLGQIEEKALRQLVSYLKQGLENEDKLDYICDTLRSWGHFNFQCYLVRTGPMNAFLCSKIIFLTILDIIDTNPNDGENFTSH